jgi:hypothetical protein
MIAFSLCAQFVRVLWGDNAYVRFGIITAGIALVLWGVVAFVQQALWRQLSEMDPSERDFLRTEDPEMDEFWADRPRVGEHKDWAWRVQRIGWGLMAFIYPPALSILIRTGRLSMDSDFTAYEIGAMCIGVVMFIAVGRWRLKRYHCRRCGETPVRLRGETPRFSCARCGIIWNLGNV